MIGPPPNTALEPTRIGALGSPRVCGFSCAFGPRGSLLRACAATVWQAAWERWAQAHRMNTGTVSQKRRKGWRELLYVSMALGVSSCSTRETKTVARTSVPGSASSQRDTFGGPAQDEIRDRPVTEQDLRILLRADEL